MEKACFKCAIIKPLDEFYTHPMMADGHLNKCIECAKADARATRAARLEYYKTYDRRRNREPERALERRERNRRYTKPRPETDPIKRAARTALGNALRDGKITKPPECEVCAGVTDLHGHHEDYSEPLVVIWVCAPCHAFIHAYWRAQERVAA